MMKRSDRDGDFPNLSMSPLLSKALLQVPVSVIVISSRGVIVEMNDIAGAQFKMLLSFGDNVFAKIKDQNNCPFDPSMINQGIFILGELSYNFVCGKFSNEGNTYKNMFVFGGGSIVNRNGDILPNRNSDDYGDTISLNKINEDLIRCEGNAGSDLNESEMGCVVSDAESFNNIPCGIVIVDRKTGLIDLCNQNATSWINLQMGQEFENSLSSFKDFLVLPEECDRLLTLVAQEHNSNQVEHRDNVSEVSIRTKHGRVYSFKCQSVGHVSKRIHWLISDITAISNAMEEKHSAIIRYMRCTSHDMRTPMQAISLAAHSLSDDSTDPKGDIDTIISSSTVLETIVSNVLEFKTISSMKLVPIPKQVDVRENLNRIVHILKHSTLVSEDVVLSSVCNWNDTFSIEADSQMLDRIVLNLVTNALKFTQKGFVKVTCSLDECLGGMSLEEHPVSEESNQRLLKIAIEDTGCGMDETSQEHVGELDFFSGEAGGFGLGTFIVRTYIQALHGNFNVKSTVGVGTTMTVEIPTKVNKRNSSSKKGRHEGEPRDKKQDVPKRSFQRRIVQQPPSQNGGLVLVVEDISVNRKLLVKSLTKGGFEVDQAENGLIALKMMLENNYNTVFMDINMPVMNGDVAVREYWKQCDPTLKQHPKIIMLTGNITDADREMALACGAHEFLTKPVVPKQLWAAAALFRTSLSTSDEQTDDEESPKSRQRLSYDDFTLTWKKQHP